MTVGEKKEQELYEAGYNAAFEEIEEILRVEAVRLDHELEQPYPKDVHYGLKCSRREFNAIRAEMLKE